MDRTPSSSSSRSRVTQSTRATSVSARSGRSSACNKGFQQHLIDYKVYPEGYEAGDGLPSFEPSDLDKIQEALFADRASLSPSQFTQEAFQDFKGKNNRVIFESDVMSTVIPVICGDSRIHSQQNVLFTELEPITSTDAVKPKPDLFDGAFLADVDVNIRDDPALRPKIIPTKHRSVPVASNFFMEVKGPDGNASVAKTQACYDGAYGARAMHALQSHGKAKENYDGNSYTYSSTYHPATGTLQLYAHHVTAPIDAGGRPEYHMTQIDGWQVTGNINSFRRGATAFRNARDLARQHRDQFIQAANARHASQDAQQNNENGQAAQDFQDALQSLHTGDDTPNPSQASTILAAEDQDLSFATSFTSSSGNGPPVGSKRARQLSSPNNSWGRSSSKSRTRINISELNKELSKKEQVEVDPPAHNHMSDESKRTGLPASSEERGEGVCK